MHEQNINYFSYLLRVWKDSVDGEWHASLQDVVSGECHHYPTLYELYVNLWDLTNENVNNPDRSPFEPFKAQLARKME
jgi:hypothetical protein